MNIDQAYLSLKQAAQEFALSYTTLRRDVERGLLPAFRTGRKYFVSRADAAAYAERYRSSRLPEQEGYSIKQLMEMLPLSYAFLIELIHSGQLSAIKCGRRYIVSPEALEQFLSQARLPEKQRG